MTASRSDGFAGGVLAALIAVLIVAGHTTPPAAAQGRIQGPENADVGRPVRLGPPEEKARLVDHQIDEMGADDAVGSDVPTPESREAVTLQEPGENRAPLEAKARVPAEPPEPFTPPLGTGRGNDLSLTERLLPALPVETASPAMYNLMRRLLLSDMAAPAGEGPNGDLVAGRVERLLAMGEIDAAFEILEASPLVEVNERVARRFIEALFYADNNTDACTEVRNRIRRYRAAFWRQSFVFCQALAGETDKAALGAEVLHEEGMVEDAAFFTLIDAVMGNPEARINSLSDPTPLQIAMLRASRQPFPEDAAGSTKPAVLQTLAMSPNANRETRLFAAERVVAGGALPVPVLVQLYESFDFMPEQLASLGNETELAPSPEGRALIYQAVKARPTPTKRARLLQKSLRFARRHGSYEILVRVLQPTLLDIQPSPEFVWFAVDAARALYASGRPHEANTWYDLLRAQASGDAAAAAAELELWPLARIAGANGMEPLTSVRLVRLREQLLAAAAEGASDRAALFYGLLDGLGETMTADDWQALIRQGELAQGELATTVMPSATLWHALRAAAQEARVEDTILFVLLSLGGAGPAAASPIILNSAVTSLRLVGLEEDARALALEAAIDGGL